MKIFDVGNSINFVDDNDRFVGYNLDQQCCEDATWQFSSYNEKTGLPDNLEELTFVDEEPCTSEYDSYEGTTSQILFKLSDGTCLVLENTHEGYYSHGFTYKLSEKNQGSGSL